MKLQPFLILIPLILNHVPISTQRSASSDRISVAISPSPIISVAKSPSPFSETPAMSPESPATAPAPMKDFKQVWLETNTPISSPGLQTLEQIKKTCAAADYSSLCQSSVIPLFSSKSAGSSSFSVLQMAIKAAAAETASAISDADSLSISPETDDETVSSLDDCLSSYQSVLTDFNDAESAFEKHDKGTMSNMLSAAMADIRSCTEGFDDPNPVKKKNDKLSQMASNCLAIAELDK
ncbi:hypothetical protein M5689_005357 [Euphorbia peplus]|nr:hypothetical protein M5689_005357 [Euphorbia peplus]